MVTNVCKNQDAVLIRRDGRLGRITLNRPGARNALTLPMVTAMSHALEAWEHDPGVATVVLDGAGEHGFCAGGDVTVLHRSARDDHAIARALWSAEYRLDAQLARYRKPVVSLMDGMVMGGGIGITAHAGLRLVTERSVLAMPEVAIGLAPDVGGCLLLARAPGELGTHVALTAARIGAGEALRCGLADHVVPSARLPAVLEALRAGDDITGEFATAPPELDRDWIDACYSADSVAEILERLRRRPEPEAAGAAAAISGASPTALKVTLRALRRAREMSTIEECLVQDYRVSCRFLASHDLAEGIRAVVIDKDRDPRWWPRSLDAVSDAMVQRHFEPLGDGADLRLGQAQRPAGL